MGTRWKGLLAPINVSTGDGRRMAPGAFTHRPLPVALKWQRLDEEGHDTSIVIGLADTINIDEAAGEVWGEGELFDDQPQLERLTADVAEAMLLTQKKVIGPSVDPGAAEAVLVEIGSNEPLTGDRLDQLLMESFDTGVDPPIEVLFTTYEIAAATLVPIPAFTEARPFELLPAAASAQPAPAAALTASVNADDWDELPLATQDTPWNETDAIARIATACGLDGDTPDFDCYGDNFLYLDDAAGPASADSYQFPLCDVTDAGTQIIPAAVTATGDAVNAMLQPGADTGGISPAEVEAMQQVLEGLYARMADEFGDPTIMPPWAAESAAPASNVDLSLLLQSLTASTSGLPRVPRTVFDDPHLAGPTNITTKDLGEGFVRVYGHVAPHGVCHTGLLDACYTAPLTVSDYVPFHRYVVDVADGGLASVGRITAGMGKLGTGCTHRACRGKGDHACNQASLAETISHHDDMTVLAWVRAGEDEHGIWVAGIAAPGLTKAATKVLNGNRFSGDWRDVGGNLELVEVLGLNAEQPAFPIPAVTITDGRRISLTACLPVRNPTLAAAAAASGRLPSVDYQLLGKAVAAELAKLGLLVSPVAAAEPPPAEQTDQSDAPPVHTGAMVAFRMSEDDAAALAVDGGEPVEELHITVAYLGEADALDTLVRQSIVEACEALAQQWAPIPATTSSVVVFNPNTDEHETAVATGVEGVDMTAAHAALMQALAVVCPQMPDQHAPWLAHITLQYEPQGDVVAAFADRTNQPITLDRIRVAFAGEITDLSLAGMQIPIVGESAADLFGDVEAALASVAAMDERAALLAEVAGV